MGSCTLGEIGAACLDFQRTELSNVERNIRTYARNSLGIEIPKAIRDWFECTRSQRKQQLPTGAVDYILEHE